MRREHRQPTRAELALITSRRPVVRRVIRAGRSARKANQLPIPDAPKKFYANHKHVFAPSEGGQ
jgi:hypothetical protein